MKPKSTTKAMRKMNMCGNEGNLIFLRHVKLGLFACVLFVVVLTTFVFQDIPKIAKINEFEETKDVILSISSFFAVFSLLLLFVANTISDKAKHAGIEVVGRNLMKRCRTVILFVFLLSTLVVVSIISTAYRHSEYAVFAINCALSLVIAVSIMLALDLRQITVLLRNKHRQRPHP